MHALLAPYLAAALLLVLAGAPKVLDPSATLRSTRETGLPVGAAAVRLFGAFEVAVGLAAVLVGGPVPAFLVAVSYLAFGAFVLRGLVRKDLTSCGCFSGDDAPPSALHVVLDGLLAVVALIIAFDSRDAWLASGADGPQLALVAVLAVVDALVLYLLLAKLPRLGGARLAEAAR